jgi:SnoaL-like domain
VTRRRQIAVLAVAVAGTLAFWMWWNAPTSAEREVKKVFVDLVAEFNSGTTEGFGTIAHAARIGAFFTPDVVVELGQGTAPIHGRDTLIGMAVRLQPRTAAFAVELDDVNVEFRDAIRADVTLTAVIRRRSVESGDSIDAREFAAEVVNLGGGWKIGRVIAVDTLR